MSDTVIAVTISVRAATEVNDDLVESFARLIPQLSSSSPAPSASDLLSIIDNPNSVLFIAEVEIDDVRSVVGSLTLAFYRIPTGLKAWIEDVVVDESARGLGVGEALNVAAIDEARQRGLVGSMQAATGSAAGLATTARTLLQAAGNAPRPAAPAPVSAGASGAAAARVLAQSKVRATPQEGS